MNEYLKQVIAELEKAIEDAKPKGTLDGLYSIAPETYNLISAATKAATLLHVASGDAK